MRRTYQEGVKTNFRKLAIIRTTSVLEKEFQRQSGLVLFYEDILGRPRLKGSGETDGKFPVGEVFLEKVQVLCLVTEVELLVHHATKDFNFFLQRQPFHAGQESDEPRKEAHDSEVTANCFLDAWVEDLHCDRGSWNGRGGMWEGEGSSMELLFSFGVLIGWR